MMKTAFLVLLCSLGAWAQSIATTAPTASQIIQAPGSMLMSATVTQPASGAYTRA